MVLEASKLRNKGKKAYQELPSQYVEKIIHIEKRALAKSM